MSDMELIEGLRHDAGEYATFCQTVDVKGLQLSWDQSNVRAWDAAELLEKRTAEVKAVLNLHDPVEIYIGSTTEEILAAVNTGSEPILTVCRECTPDEVIEQIGDCEWDEDSQTVTWPCSTVVALKERGR